MTTSTPITGDPAVSDLAVGAQGAPSAAGGERADLLATLAKHRHFLAFTTRGLTDEQARQRTTVSELSLGGLIKHVTSAERGWVDFIVDGPSAIGDSSAMTEDDWARRAEEFRLLPSETLAGERWSARRVLLHIIAETAQHAGHADIIRESLDGAKSMG